MVCNYGNMKALWISQFDMAAVYTDNGKQRNEESFKKLVGIMLDKTVFTGFNTVIFQIRPYADSMYPSKLCPPCSMVTGSYGTKLTYDPFAIVLKQAHERGLSVQAWINPMRAMPDEDMKLVDDGYVIKQWYNDASKRGKYIVSVAGRWYLNPAYKEVREHICKGAVEILDSYDVDGLHMDDYFYPTADASFDADAYGEYKENGGCDDLPSFRKASLSSLVAGLYKVTKDKNSKLIFGISPAGNIKTVAGSHSADVYKWCSQSGYIDYIAPQVYFGFEHESCDFKTVCETWQSTIKKDNISLIIGMTLGKAKSGIDNYAGSGKNEWIENKDIMLRCLRCTETLTKCRGVAYFCYQYFFSPVTGEEEQATKAERDKFVPYLKDISWN